MAAPKRCAHVHRCAREFRRDDTSCVHTTHRAFVVFLMQIISAVDALFFH